MSWVAVDGWDGAEVVFNVKPRYSDKRNAWLIDGDDDAAIILPKGSIKKLIGRGLTWQDNPVELK